MDWIVVAKQSWIKYTFCDSVDHYMYYCRSLLRNFSGISVLIVIELKIVTLSSQFSSLAELERLGEPCSRYIESSTKITLSIGIVKICAVVIPRP